MAVQCEPDRVWPSSVSLPYDREHVPTIAVWSRACPSFYSAWSWACPCYCSGIMSLSLLLQQDHEIASVIAAWSWACPCYCSGIAKPRPARKLAYTIAMRLILPDGLISICVGDPLSLHLCNWLMAGVIDSSINTYLKLVNYHPFLKSCFRMTPPMCGSCHSRILSHWLHRGNSNATHYMIITSTCKHADFEKRKHTHIRV